MKTVTIIGGGLAGLSLGIGLRKRGVPVELHEAGTYPRHRVCGEFICGVDGDILEQLGIADVLADSVKNRRSAWFRGDRRILDRPLPSTALGISRHRLDAALAERFVTAGGHLHTNSRVAEIAPAAGRVIAAGRPRQGGSKWIGLKAHFRRIDLPTDLEMHLGRDGYLGLSRIEDEIVNVCGLFRLRRGLKARRDSRLMEYARESGLSRATRRLKGGTIVPGSATGVSAFHLGRQSRDGERSKQFTVGDRFAIIGPFTGNGMSMAFESAALSLPPLLAWAGHEIPWSTAIARQQRRLERSFRRRLRLSRWMHPLLMSGAGQCLLEGLSRARLLPFSLLFRALR